MTNPPYDAELNCTEVREQMHALHDGELQSADSAAVSRHLASCTACAREYDQLRQASDAMRQQLQRFPAPDLLRARVRAALRNPQEDRGANSPAPAYRANWLRQLVAAVLLMSAGGGITALVMRGRPAPGEQINSDIVASHVRSLMAQHLTDIASTDQHNVKPWFNGKVAFSPEVYHLEDLGFPLIGGRLDSLARQQVAVIVYGRRQHIISLYTWPAVIGPSAAPDTSVLTERGYHAIQWIHEGMQFWAVSDVGVPDLRMFVDDFRRAAAQ